MFKNYSACPSPKEDLIVNKYENEAYYPTNYGKVSINLIPGEHIVTRD